MVRLEPEDLRQLVQRIGRRELPADLHRGQVVGRQPTPLGKLLLGKVLLARN